MSIFKKVDIISTTAKKKEDIYNIAVDDCQEALNKKIEEVCDVGEIGEIFHNIVINEFLHSDKNIPVKYFVARLIDRKSELAQAISKHIKEGMK